MDVNEIQTPSLIIDYKIFEDNIYLPITALLDAANKQEQFFVDNREYTTVLADLGVASKTENNFYTISVTVDNDAGTFEFTATPASGPVLQDTECTSLSISDTGLKTSKGSANAKECWGR